MTREEFIGRAAEGLRTLYAPGVDEQHLRNLATAALDAVGAFELLEALRPIVTSDGGGSFRNLTGMNAELALLAIAKAEGR